MLFTLFSIPIIIDDIVYFKYPLNILYSLHNWLDFSLKQNLVLVSGSWFLKLLSPIPHFIILL